MSHREGIRMEATVGNGWQRLQACSISSCTTSPKHEFVALCGTTYERVCGLRSGVGGQLPKVIHVLGSHVIQKAVLAFLMGKRERRKVLGRSHCKTSFSSSNSLSAKALHFL